jgi:hypothetical protein
LCDASYRCQWERLEREALAMQAQAPYVEEGTKIPSPSDVQAEFDGWLNEAPQHQSMTREELDRLELYRLLGVAKGR